MIRFQWPITLKKRQVTALGERSEWIPFSNNWPPTSAQTIATVGRCLRIYSDFLSEVPIVSEPKDHYLLDLLEEPNSFMSKQNLYETLAFELLLNGNFISRVLYNERGQITQILPYRSGQVYCYATKGEYSDALSIEQGGFYYKDFKGRVLLSDSIWHLKDLMFGNTDQLNGLSRVYLYATQFRAGASLNQTEESLVANGLKPPWLLTGMPEADSTEISEVRESVATFLKGGAQGVLTVPPGFDLKSMMLQSPAAALQYLASKSDLDISRIFSIPVQLISRADGNVQGSANDLKESTRFFIKSSLKSFLKNVSDSLERLAMDGTKFNFEVDRFRASDLREQAQYISQLVEKQVLSVEEAKKLL